MGCGKRVGVYSVSAVFLDCFFLRDECVFIGVCGCLLKWAFVECGGVSALWCVRAFFGRGFVEWVLLFCV